MADATLADLFPEPGPDPKLCPVVLGAHQCQRLPGHTDFHLCVPAERALELQPSMWD